MKPVTTGEVGPAVVAGPWLWTLPLQAEPPVDVPMGDPMVNVAGSAIGAFLTTLLVGAIMVAVTPEYTRRRMDQVLENPVGTFVYGLVSIVFVLLVTLLLAVTVVGIVLAIPVAVLAYVVWAIGSAVAFLAIGDRLVGHEEGWTRPLVVGAGVNGLLTLTGVGGLVSFCIGAAGFGAVLRAYLE